MEVTSKVMRGTRKPGFLKRQYQLLPNLSYIVEAAKSWKSRYNSRWSSRYMQINSTKRLNSLQKKINPVDSENSKTFTIKSIIPLVYIYMIFFCNLWSLDFLFLSSVRVERFFIDWLDWLLIFLATYSRISLSIIGITLLMAWYCNY